MDNLNTMNYTNKPSFKANYIDDEDFPRKDHRCSLMTFNNDNNNNNNNNNSSNTNTNTKCNLCTKPTPNLNSSYELNSNFTNLNNNPSSITSELRLINLERRLDNNEKMLKFYDDMFRLKDEEKRNEYRIDQGRVNELSKKIANLEEVIKLLHKRINEQNELINEKFDLIEKKFNKFAETKNSIGDFYANKLAEVEALIKKNDVVIESLIDEKVASMQLNTDNKLEEFLNLVNDIGKATEQNEFSIIETKESIRMIQTDHLDFIKIVAILKEKADTLDYIMLQITELKQRYSRLVQVYGENSQEEDKFLNKIFSARGDD